MTIPSWARVGAEVVCINADGTNTAGLPELEAGSRYKLRWVGYFAHPLLPGAGARATVRLEGVIRKSRDDAAYGLVDIPFYISRFRPVIARTLEQEVSRFLPLLNIKGLVD